jgi:hypothetical protein
VTTSATDDVQRRDARDALLWATGVSWAGVLAIGAVLMLAHLAAVILGAFLAALMPHSAERDATGWLVAVGATAMGLCLVSGVGSAWVLARGPGARTQPWLLGSLCGLFGWAMGAVVLALAVRVGAHGS